MQSQMEFKTTERFKRRTGLQIFVDRFYREGAPPELEEGCILKQWNDPIPNWEPDSDGEYQNNYFYGGNLRGIKAKLDFIKANGFNMLYLSPLGKSKTSHHYEPEDQLQIDSVIGTVQDFQELCEEAHRKDILIAVDLVFNHMGVTSHIFQNALSGSNSRYYDWFEWNQDGNPVYWGNLDESILEHYRYLGQFRNNHRQFFSEAGEIKIEASCERMRITRKNTFGEMTLYLIRNTEFKKVAWGINVA